MAGPNKQPTRYQGVYVYPGTRGKCYYITFHLDGKMVWEKVGYDHEGVTPELARDKRASRFLQLRHGEILPKSKEGPTISDGFVTYFNFLQREHKPRLYGDTLTYNKWIRDTMGSEKMGKVTASRLDSLRERVWDAAGPTVGRTILTLLRRMYNYNMKKDKYTGANPIIKTDIPKEGKDKGRFYTNEEVNRILKELKVRNQDMWEIAVISVNTGMRRGEILAIQKQNLDFEGTGYIKVPTKDSKTKRDRFVAMPPIVKEILENKNLTPGRPVFKWRDDPWASAIKAAKVNEGITDNSLIGTFHTLRHTYASRLALGGKSLWEIANALGHTSVKLVNRYAHLCKDGASRIALEMEFVPEGYEKKEQGLRLVVNNK